SNLLIPLMKSILTIGLVVYGAIIAGLSLLTHYLAPETARTILVTGLAGGALCILWGVLGMLGRGGRPWAVLTLIVVSFMLLSQTVMSWLGASGDEPVNTVVKVLVTIMFLLSIGTVTILAHAGGGSVERGERGA
ncbi:MAG: hypothetical protein M1608_11300, partial [Candidatus Omnitrophica bacterium]|nr:hypothetical protein [Candidatus Omnitrophota bacterium]